MPGDSVEDILVSGSAVPSLHHYCRGGEHCCQRDSYNLCMEGEGDCNTDQECQGMLECGSNNCGMEGGLWDEKDDCCQRRCSLDRPCPQGRVGIQVQIQGKAKVPEQGPCESDQECERPGYNICAGSCTDRALFPISEYPNNTQAYGYEETHR